MKRSHCLLNRASMILLLTEGRVICQQRSSLATRFLKIQFILIILGSHFLSTAQTFTKVVVPALYKEWVHHKPIWFTDAALQKAYGFTTFLYQKLDPHSPNYMSTNRGCESGPYFRYIVDHYDSFPDVAIFIHAKPEEHQASWLDLVRCISPNATYISLNLEKMLCRSSWNGLWARYGIWLEQCIRDVLRIVHGYQNVTELNEHYPPNKPINMCLHCCQQFIMSRKMVHARPLSVWKELQKIMTVQDVCHVGLPDYENLFSFNHSQRLEIGPEPPEFQKGRGGGRYTQGLTSEHLAHVIFGQLPIEMKAPTMEEICQNFLPNTSCPGSPLLLVPMHRVSLPPSPLAWVPNTANLSFPQWYGLKPWLAACVLWSNIKDEELLKACCAQGTLFQK